MYVYKYINRNDSVNIASCCYGYYCQSFWYIRDNVQPGDRYGEINPDMVMQGPDANWKGLESPRRGLFCNNDQHTVHYLTYYIATY